MPPFQGWGILDDDRSQGVALVCPEGDGRDDFHGVRFVSAAAMAVAAMQGERGGTRDVLI